MGPIIVVVPCYNEEKRLNVEAFQDFLESQNKASLLFVNDGSRDDTIRLLREIEDTTPRGRCAVLDLEKNQGKAGAVRQGILHALTYSPEVVGFWDADLATPLASIFDLYDLMGTSETYEIVTAARALMLGKDIRRKAMRHYLGRCFAMVASFLLDLSVYDTQCGAKLFRVTPWLRDLYHAPFSSKWIFDVELLLRRKVLGVRLGLPSLEEIVVEHPLSSWEDVHGSKLKGRDFFLVQRDLVTIRLDYLRRLNAPLAEIAPHLFEKTNKARK
ncbi:MAG: glycosyltransferase [Myxococcales bacterium]|nr:glycosyltransferase [Myxococcales bacterium]MCB9643280.1 glycosyltransferase [Myxococcales bacterium]